MNYTRIPTNTFEEIQLNAGIIADSFTPDTGEVGNLIGATTGGTNFNSAPTFSDYGEDIDNCPKNTKELKKLDSYEITMSGTFVTLSADMAKRLVASADMGTGDIAKITPRNDLLQSDFTDLWWIGDYSNVNTGTGAGFVAIHMLNTLSTGGFQIQSTDNGKGQFAFTFTAHYSMDAQDTVPFEIYVKSGVDEETPVDPIPPVEDEYTPVENPTGNPSEQGWYELVDGSYVLTEDTEVVEDKTYYIRVQGA